MTTADSRYSQRTSRQLTQIVRQSSFNSAGQTGGDTLKTCSCNRTRTFLREALASERLNHPGGGSRVGPNTSAEKGHVGSNATIAMLAARACSGAPPLAAAHQWRVGRLLFKIFVSSAALLLLAHVSLDLIGIRERGARKQRKKQRDEVGRTHQGLFRNVASPRDLSFPNKEEKGGWERKRKEAALLFFFPLLLMLFCFLASIIIICGMSESLWGGKGLVGKKHCELLVELFMWMTADFSSDKGTKMMVIQATTMRSRNKTPDSLVLLILLVNMN
ncbi:hypothetical protein C4D60_Mb01t03340 [Musa balbisiana]|uniref:Uncharacterized protein n=1 Tax=Musa balbisiana TaxID=52838 RepID=A0A4S8JJJ1_MUSBA|nr:hypothetical protein C4D60_Mb01t03340 [Musa balbisiana]